MRLVKMILLKGCFMGCSLMNMYAQQTISKNRVLNPQQQSVVVISALTSKGNLARLYEAINEGLNAGLTVNDMKEVMVQLYAYTGFPRSLNALQTLMDVLKERKLKGLTDEPGKTPTSLPAEKSKLQFGTEMQTKLIGRPVKGELYEFAPLIDQFLKEHLFGDIFGRDNLDWKTRELATIAALASLGNVESQLRAHFGVGLYNGLKAEQLQELVSIVHSYIGPTEGNVAKQVLEAILSGRQNNNNTETTAANKRLFTPISDTPIFSKGQKITNNNFTGNAWLQQMIVPDNSNHTQVGNVTFEPGSRTNWHSHPAGQILLITAGTGYYQERGSAKRIIRKGEVINCPANVPHWQGASKDEHLIHVAISNTQKGAPVWLEAVTDEEYLR